MKMLQAVLAAISLAGIAYGQLSIGSVTNAASYLYSPLPNSAIAQGAFFAILGNGGQSPTGVTAWNTFPLPTSVNGTSVAVTVNGATREAYIYYVGPAWGAYDTQIDAVMPSATPTGVGILVVTQNGISTPPYPVTVVASSPGTYSLNGAGSGPGVFYNVAGDGSTLQNNLFHTARPGQIVELHGTGLSGAANPALEATQPPTQVDVRTTNMLVDVWVGNQQATVQYAGRSSYTGEDEIAFTVPAGVVGCYNEVAVYAGAPGTQTVSNFTSLAVDPNGSPCQDADGINMQDLAGAIERKGSASVGAISLLSSYQNLFIPLLGTLQWDEDTVNGQISSLTTQQLNASFGYTVLPSVDNCASYTYLQYPPPLDPVLGGVFGPVVNLDAGPSLRITGPNGTQPVTKTPSGVYNALVGGSTISTLLIGGGLPPFFLNAQGWGTSSWSYAIPPGNYAVSAPGGLDVGAFSASLSVSPSAASFKWINPPSPGATISRSIPLTISWTGGDPNGFVEIEATASTQPAGFTPTPSTPGAIVQCMAPANAGTFTIPVHVLQSLASTAGSTATLPPGALLVGPASGAVKFSPTPSGLDAAYLFYQYVAGGTVVWQ